MPVLVALGAGLVLVPAARWAGQALGVVDRPGDPLRIHSRPVSLLGGAAVVGASAAGLAIAGHPLPVWVWSGIVVALGVGVADDLRTLPAWIRLLGQACAGILLAIGGLRLLPFGPLAAVAVVVLVLITTNAVNILDGQDGLAGGLAAISSLALAGVLGTADDVPGAMALSLAGGLIAFLLWNRPPASIFLGNGGAYALGTALAVPVTAAVARDGWAGFVAALLCLAPFAFELLFTVARRVRARRPITVGDRLHSYDMLARVTGGRTTSTLTFWALGAAAGGLALVVDAAT
jgi:UDP-GlcNAc:undecaprenyl-phosphate GlcNAc-1-phosphate transferase